MEIDTGGVRKEETKATTEQNSAGFTQKEQALTAYKKDGSTLYIEEETTEQRIETFMGFAHVKVSPVTNTLIHHVCNAHFGRYFMLRRVTPRVCVIYDTLLERENVLAAMGWDV